MPEADPRRAPPHRRLLRHPEIGAAAGALLVWLLFAVAAGAPFRTLPGTAAVLDAAAPLGILSAAVALLMVGGEFDLSVGSTIGAAGMAVMLLTTRFGWGVWPAMAAALALAALIGLANGLLVVRTGLPSFLVTLGTLFIVRGLTIAGTRLLTGRTQLGGLESARGFASARLLLGSEPAPGFDVALLWWIAATLAGAWALRRTRFGNWVLAAGGAEKAARAMGVPVRRVKVALFVATALAAALVAFLQAVRYGGADALRGETQEFRAIVAVVIGGTLLTGGYGSVLGAALGALIYGMVQQGIVITGVDADWFQVFLGGVLVAAVLFNRWIRSRALEAA